MEQIDLPLEDRKRIAWMLKSMAQWLKGSPDFAQKQILADWGNALKPYWGEQLIRVMNKAHHRWDYWPSFRQLISAAGFEPESPDQEIEDAIMSIWNHLERGHNLTVMGGRIFDALGGWQTIGATAMDAGAKRHWEKRFWDMGRKLQHKDANPDLETPALPAPEDDPQNGIADPETYLEQKAFETHCMLVKPALEEDTPYDERKAKALAEGQTYWEPPRSWELAGEMGRDNFKLTPHERKLWCKKVMREIKNSPTLNSCNSLLDSV